MLVTMKELVQDARKRNYGVGFFNTFDVEMAMGVISAAEKMNAPVMIGTAEVLLPACDMDLAFQLLHFAASRAKVPVALHLDHGYTPECVKRAIDLGYTSVMYDMSSFAYEENVAGLKEMTDYAHKKGVSVEGELGHVVFDVQGDVGDIYTRPEDVEDFVARTDVDALAIAIGTAHGVYKTAPKLDLERLRAIRKVTDIGLVLHGGSGLSDDDFRNVVRDGIQKVNVYTDISYAGTQAAYDMVKAGDKAIEHVSVAVREAIERATMEKLKLFGCEGKA